MRVLVTGATGYIGGRLVPRLLASGHDVRVLVRDARRVRGRAWAERVEVAEGDLLAPASLAGLADGCDAAYYLVHSMSSGAGFDERDRDAAGHFADAAIAASAPLPPGGAGGGTAAATPRIAGGSRSSHPPGADADPRPAHVIYLGGIMPDGHRSEHLRSRAETGRVLGERLPGRVTEFRAGPIIGSGSASFEMLRYLTERLPAMVAPKWIKNLVQPIAVRDVLAYMVAALDAGPSGVVAVGGDRLTFRDMMHVYAEERGLPKRLIVDLPVLAPKLAGLWVGLVTPIPNRIALPLVEGILAPVIADTAEAAARFPEIEPLPYRDAVRRALQRIEKDMVETRWSTALGRSSHFELQDEEGLIREVRQRPVAASPAAVFAAFTSLGGEKGWLTFGWAWALRGLLDQLVGGPGLRRGRRHPTDLLVGESLDFWRVERVERPSDANGHTGLLRLRAEMKVPGKAWLQFETRPEDGSADVPRRACVTQTALFEPKGLPGLLYWYALYPVHMLIFSAMAKALARDAEGGGSGGAAADGETDTGASEGVDGANTGSAEAGGAAA